ncbi:sensor histidine kinase [Herpetosiphon giganteus]|uniref:sensor histidine kinase n=1 Tax=Herpetosiphon giganteus TaxID=2029754 RepID=UPI00195ABDFE|nr:HAMP domain-containing sensor histidine kinase [Herpetosiphon giganteus]MBM7841724.1 signal transduction histidine kinase [Herpetosiphon giganteus]
MPEQAPLSWKARGWRWIKQWWQDIVHGADPFATLTAILALFTGLIGIMGAFNLDYGGAPTGVILLDFGVALCLGGLAWWMFRQPSAMWPRWIVVSVLTLACFYVLATIPSDAAVVVLTMLPILMAMLASRRWWPIAFYPLSVTIVASLHTGGWQVFTPAIIAFNILEFLMLWGVTSQAVQFAKARVKTEAQLSKEQQVRQFMRFFQHELRSYSNSLDVLLPMLNQQLSERPTPEQSAIQPQELVSVLQSTADSIRQLTTELLVLTREGQLLPQQRMPIQLLPLLQSEQAESQAEMQRHGLNSTIQIDCPAECIVIGDALFLRLAVHTILQNAIEALLRYPDEGQIFIQVEQSAQQTTIDIYDTGKGFSADLLEHLNQAQSLNQALGWTTKIGGSGLGMPLIRHVAMLHGGTAHFMNRPEGGAQIRLALPQV